jgi:hypothetical protein
MTRMRMGRNDGTQVRPGDSYAEARQAIFDQVVQRRRENARNGVTHVSWVKRQLVFISGGLFTLASFFWLIIPYNVIFIVVSAALPDLYNGVDVAKWIMMSVAVPYMLWVVFRFQFPALADIRWLYGEKGENDHFVQVADIAAIVAVRRKQAISEVVQMMRRFHA